MDKYNYLIEFISDLGVKKGTLEISINEDKIKGLLTLLAHTEPVYGKINKNGKCKIYGKIVSLIKESKYIATGYINSDNLNLNMKIGSYRYPMIGIACSNIQSNN